MANGAELVQYREDANSVTLWRQPEQILAEAQQAATCLVKVIGMKKTPVKFNGETYLEFEDWQTVGKFYGCTTKITKTDFVEYGGVKGFEAIAVVLDRNQNEIGRAESMCLSDEANWGDVPIYEWKDELDANGKKQWVEGTNGKKGHYKGSRVQTGTAPKPLFQLRSMAQTRAAAKALKSIFSWVVVLAGYRPQVAEEMTGNEFDQRPQEEPKPQVQMPQSSQRPQGGPAQEGQVKIAGAIESSKPGKDGILWLMVDKKFVVVPENKVSPLMVAGAKIEVLATRKKGRENEFWLVDSVEAIEAAPEKKADSKPVEQPEQKSQGMAGTGLTEEDKKTIEGIFPSEPERKNPEEDKSKIGVKRAQVIYALITNNQKTSGFTESELKKVMASLPVPIEHLRDLEIGMYDQIKRWATGEDGSWKE